MLLPVIKVPNSFEQQSEYRSWDVEVGLILVDEEVRRRVAGEKYHFIGIAIF